MTDGLMGKYLEQKQQNIIKREVDSFRGVYRSSLDCYCERLLEISALPSVGFQNGSVAKYATRFIMFSEVLKHYIDIF